MKITGIIAEYNPFHNGHLYQFEQTRCRSGSDYLIVVMSGNFVQRGEPAIYDKYTRTRAALNAGADLVLELPAPFAVSSAEDFAAGAVALLDQLGVVDELSFGSECGDTTALDELATILIQEPAGYQEQLRQALKSGLTYPQSRNLALRSWLEAQPQPALLPELADQLLASPNNILGIEYIKAIKKRNSAIHPMTITRMGQGYHDTYLDRGFASASGIRNAIRNTGETAFPAALFHQVPSSVYSCYQNAAALFADDLSLLLNQTLLRLNQEQIPFSAFADLSEESAARLKKHLLEFAPFSKRIEQLKTRQFTYTRISRALLHLVLEIRTSDLVHYRELDYSPYARILGFRREAQPLLAMIKQHSAVPMITKTAAARDLLSAAAWEMFQKDLYCSHVYQTIQHQKSGETPRNEYTQSVIVV
ncbi:MAG: nucleotidyltransferase [Lachnospiraceae bacterium]